MKMAFIANSWVTEYNGHYYSTNLNQTFWEKRYLRFFDEVIVIARVKKTDTDPSGRYVLSDNERVHFKCLPYGSIFSRLLHARRDSAFVLSAIGDCDSVVCRGWWGAFECKKLHKNYLIESVSCVWDALWNHSLPGKCVALPVYLMQRKAIQDAPYVLYVTKEFLQKRYPTKGMTVNCSNVELVTMDEAVLQKRLEKIERHEGKLVIGTTAAVNVKYKGQQYVIQALGELKKKGITRFEYQLVGNGNQEYLKSIAKKYDVEDQVKLLGGMLHDKVFDWLDSIDIYVQPSKQEGLPRALIEAMSRGLPAFGAHTGGIPELLDDKYIFHKDRKMVDRICAILESYDSDTMKAQAAVNFETAKEYQKEILDERRTNFYRKVFSGDGDRPN